MGKIKLHNWSGIAELVGAHARADQNSVMFYAFLLLVSFFRCCLTKISYFSAQKHYLY